MEHKYVPCPILDLHKFDNDSVKINNIKLKALVVSFLTMTNGGFVLGLSMLFSNK
jgi:hypothetical protein